jgi:hypothetical protein
MSSIVENIKQLLYGLAFFLLTTMVAIGVSIKLDKSINYELSNLTGLFVSYFIDFFIQKKIFMKNLNVKNKVVYLYILSSFVAIIISHFIFVNVKKHIQIHNKVFFDTKWNRYVNVIRLCISIFVYIFYHFPIYKWLLFKEIK